MNLKIFKVLISLMFIFLANITIASNIKDSVSCNGDTTSEPQYQVNFTLPKITNSSAQLVLRMYQPWGDGSSTGWQQSTVPPVVALDGQPLNVMPAFSYANQRSFQSGALSLGTDEYAQYFMVLIPETSKVGESLTITGTFQQVAYMSATVYNYAGGKGGVKWQLEKFDYEFTVLNNACNPYQITNPSVFAYSVVNINNTLTNIATTELLANSLITLPKVAVNNINSGAIGVYRLDKFDSRRAMADGIADDGCSQAYLFARKSSINQEVLVLRIKIPTTFIDNDTPDKIFEDYQVRYLSVSANVDPAIHQSNPLGYWTVNARMLKQYADKNGYGYVFFAPNDYVSNIALQQGASATQPPVMTWGKYKGYLLGDPGFAIVMRYKAPNSSWDGNPTNAICYTTSQQLKPLSANELGKYTPEVYADTMDNFMNGNIGAVNMNNIWPISR